MQTSARRRSPPRHNEWYGFGKAEEIYYRVAGAAATTSPYTVTMETVPVSPVAVAGTFNAGTVTITTEGQGHVTDTEMWVYDSGLNAIPFFGNDDTPTGLPGAGRTSSRRCRRRSRRARTSWRSRSTSSATTSRPRRTTSRRATSSTSRTRS
jgi:hypothetical protein